MNSWIEFNVYDKDAIIGKFKGGGISICTAQGSTGFNRGNGGSILPLSSDQWFVTSAFSKRIIRVPIEPIRTTITANSRTPIIVWIDGQNKIIQNVKSIEISKGDEVTVIFNDYDKFKRMKKVGVHRFMKKPINIQHFNHFIRPEIEKVKIGEYSGD